MLDVRLPKPPTCRVHANQSPAHMLFRQHAVHTQHDKTWRPVFREQVAEAYHYAPLLEGASRLLTLKKLVLMAFR